MINIQSIKFEKHKSIQNENKLTNIKKYIKQQYCLVEKKITEGGENVIWKYE